MNRERWYEIDVLKAFCILAVVYIHSISTQMGVRHPVGEFLGHWTRFAVPGLLFAAGFLFRKSDVGSGALSLRLARRILPPYVVSSLVILALGLSNTRPALGAMSPGEVIYDLATGHAVGIFYFVFLISYLYAFSFALRRCRAGLVWAIWVGSVLLTIIFYLIPFLFLPDYLFRLAPPGPENFFFVVMRHPYVYATFYLSGWVVSLSYDGIRAFLQRRALPVLVLVGAADLAVLFSLTRASGFTPVQLHIQLHVVLMIVLLLALGTRGLPGRRAVEFLSRNTYGVFLIHLPFVRSFQGLFPRITWDFSPLHSIGAWGAGVVGSLLVIVLAKLVLGRYSPHVVGS
jgi:surface polysaccharide O-acyltransferase-like enzyme